MNTHKNPNHLPDYFIDMNGKVQITKNGTIVTPGFQVLVTAFFQDGTPVTYFEMCRFPNSQIYSAKNICFTSKVGNHKITNKIHSIQVIHLDSARPEFHNGEWHIAFRFQMYKVTKCTLMADQISCDLVPYKHCDKRSGTSFCPDKNNGWKRICLNAQSFGNARRDIKWGQYNITTFVY